MYDVASEDLVRGPPPAAWDGITIRAIALHLIEGLKCPREHAVCRVFPLSRYLHVHDRPLAKPPPRRLRRRVDRDLVVEWSQTGGRPAVK